MRVNNNGVDGSRTRVQKTIPCTSTGLADCFGQSPIPFYTGESTPPYSQ